MASNYYDNSDVSQRLQPGTTARSEEIESKFDRVATGFEMVEQDIHRSIKIPAGNGDQELNASVLQRRNRVVGFDHGGNLALLSGFSWRGNWAPDTEYFVNDVVKTPSNGNWYIATVRHVSGSSFSGSSWSLGIDYASLRQLLESSLTDDLQPLVDAASQSAQSASSDADQTAADRQATGDDRAAADQSAQDAASSASEASDHADQTAADRQATGQDRDAADQSAQDAASSASAASTSRQGADSALSDFLNRYLGPHDTPPTIDNDGNALAVGALYLSTASGSKGMRYWDGTVWQTAYANLEGVTDVAGYSGAVTAAQLIVALNSAAGLDADTVDGIQGSDVWHAGNMGSGSGLDADTVDGVQASKLVRNDVNGQVVRGGFHVSGPKFYFGADKQHNLFDNDGHGNSGIQLNMDGNEVSDSGYSFELELVESNGFVNLTIFGSSGAGESVSKIQELQLQSNGYITWNGKNIFHEGDTSLPRYDLSSGTTVSALDLTQRQVFRVTANVDRTLAIDNGPGANNPGTNRAMTVVVNVYGNDGVITWPSSITWSDDQAPELRATRTTVTLLWDGENWTGFVSGGVD